MSEAKLNALAVKLRTWQCIGDDEKPFFSFCRDTCHKNEPCFFCGFTGNIHGEGRYIYSPFFEDDDVSEKERKEGLILFCGACLEALEKLDVFELDME